MRQDLCMHCEKLIIECVIWCDTHFCVLIIILGLHLCLQNTLFVHVNTPSRVSQWKASGFSNECFYDHYGKQQMKCVGLVITFISVQILISRFHKCSQDSLYNVCNKWITSQYCQWKVYGFSLAWFYVPRFVHALWKTRKKKASGSI